MSNYKKWTKEEIGFLKREYPEGSLEEISNTLERSKQAIKNKAWRMGLSKVQDKEEIEDIITPQKERIYNEIEKVSKAKQRDANVMITCTSCGESKLGSNFAFINSRMKRLAQCNSCRSKKNKNAKPV